MLSACTCAHKHACQPAAALQRASSLALLRTCTASSTLGSDEARSQQQLANPVRIRPRETLSLVCDSRRSRSCRQHAFSRQRSKPGLSSRRRDGIVTLSRTASRLFACSQANLPGPGALPRASGYFDGCLPLCITAAVAGRLRHAGSLRLSVLAVYLVQGILGLSRLALTYFYK